MSEIKFRYRIEDIKTKEVFTTILTLDKIEKRRFGFTEDIFDPFKFRTLSRDLYTGLKDYYEGDIIEFAIEGTDTHIELVNGVIEYSKKYGAFIIVGEKWNGLLYKKVGTTWDKIIGNIFENKNLLK